MATKAYKGWSVVASSTTAFTVCFMVWMMFAVIGIPIKQNLGLNETQFGILIALPVLTHRIILTPEAEMEGITTEEVIRQILAEIEIPR